MKIDEKRFPILGCFDNNKITEKIFSMLDDSGFDEEGKDGITQSFKFFNQKSLQINYISSTIHEKLIVPSNFLKAKTLLKKSEETTGLLLLPFTIYPDFSNVPDYVSVNANDYPINAILYSWLTMDNHDKIKGEFNEEEPWEDSDSRELLILPICDNRITQGTRQFEMISNDELYGTPYDDNNGRAWYGKIQDYVMSFLLFYNFTESETHIIHGIDTQKARRLKLNNEKFLNETRNNIEVIDLTYFTKLIKTGEFPVEGHFKVQHYGSENSQSKIIFVESYKKNGYLRGAKIDQKKYQ